MPEMKLYKGINLGWSSILKERICRVEQNDLHYMTKFVQKSLMLWNYDSKKLIQIYGKLNSVKYIKT